MPEKAKDGEYGMSCDGAMDGRIVIRTWISGRRWMPWMDKDRTVILLRYFEEYKISEIADIMDEKVSTIKSRLYRGIKKMRIQMENDWIWDE